MAISFHLGADHFYTVGSVDPGPPQTISLILPHSIPDLGSFLIKTLLIIPNMVTLTLQGLASHYLDC